MALPEDIRGSIDESIVSPVPLLPLTLANISKDLKMVDLDVLRSDRKA